MHRKGPPYAVAFGAEGAIPPPYVRAISVNKVLLAGNLQLLGLAAELPFPEADELDSHPALIDIMLNLNAMGVVFSYDPKAAVSPSWFMANLQDKGLLLESYQEISWRSPKLWYLTTYELL